MTGYRLTNTAKRDLGEIYLYLAREASFGVADQIEEKFFAAFDDLVRFPAIGHRREDVERRNLWFYVVKPYLIAYRRQADALIIIRVLHGKRNVASILR